MVILDFIGRKGGHILHNNRITVARRKIIVLYKFERERRKSFIIYKVMKYRKVLIKYNAYFKKAVFHSRKNIKSCIFTAVKI